MAQNYLGSKVSLISKRMIRYEGVLSEINSQESSVELSNVIFHGTEGRSKDGKEIQGNGRIYNFIKFRASDISKLTLLPQDDLSQLDSAIISQEEKSETSKLKEEKTTGTKPTSKKKLLKKVFQITQEADNLAEERVDQWVGAEVEAEEEEEEEEEAEAEVGAEEEVGVEEEVEYFMKDSNIRLIQKKPDKALSVEFKFEEMNEKFDKQKFELEITEKVKKLASGGDSKLDESEKKQIEQIKDVENIYKPKTSFFDNLIIGDKKRKTQKTLRLERNEEFKLNKETFGTTSVTQTQNKGRVYNRNNSRNYNRNYNNNYRVYNRPYQGYNQRSGYYHNNYYNNNRYYNDYNNYRGYNRGYNNYYNSYNNYNNYNNRGYNTYYRKSNTPKKIFKIKAKIQKKQIQPKHKRKNKKIILFKY